MPMLVEQNMTRLAPVHDLKILYLKSIST